MRHGPHAEPEHGGHAAALPHPVARHPQARLEDWRVRGPLGRRALCGGVARRCTRGHREPGRHRRPLGLLRSRRRPRPAVARGQAHPGAGRAGHQRHRLVCRLAHARLRRVHGPRRVAMDLRRGRARRRRRHPPGGPLRGGVDGGNVACRRAHRARRHRLVRLERAPVGHRRKGVGSAARARRRHRVPRVGAGRRAAGQRLRRRRAGNCVGPARRHSAGGDAHSAARPRRLGKLRRVAPRRRVAGKRLGRPDCRAVVHPHQRLSALARPPAGRPRGLCKRRRVGPGRPRARLRLV
mmetsp:Transcript_23573/g.60510  ORF Transcript_23573/g.60510 Transcript_23573/m.60510 type:complete len:295 (+) Transcript_23573:2090-2974(+)